MTEERRGGFIKNRRGFTAVVLALVVAAGAFVFVYFEPHKLFIDETVNEAVPVATGEPIVGTSLEPTANATFRPLKVVEGRFRSLEHDTSGSALILELGDGRRFLRFEDFETSNGPDLRVYLSSVPAGDDWFAYGEPIADLGPLKGNVGNQNYEIPADVDIARIRSAVVWCRQFSVGFGVAPLEVR